MQAFAKSWAVHGCYRGVAIALLLVLIVTPSCTSICQARTCANPQAANSDSDCHHEQGMGGMGPDVSPKLVAAGTSCGSHDWVAALPAGKSSLEKNIASTRSRNLSSFDAVSAAYAPVSTHVSYGSDTGPVRFSHWSATRQFSFDRSVTLRI